ncbi:MAG: MarR family winged helix-turn-helix transcriptional regulator [Burkholderiaceae bacterium]
MSATTPEPASVEAVRPRGCTNFKLRQLARRVTRYYDHEVGKSGLKTTQYSLLTHVARLGPVAPGELARAMTMDASTLTRNLKPLVAAGWLTLEPGTDGRSRSVALTAAGRAKRADAQRRWKVAQESVNRLLGEQRVLTLHALIDEALELLPAGDSDD